MVKTTIGYGFSDFGKRPPLIPYYFIMILRLIYKPPHDVFIIYLIRVSYWPITGRHVAFEEVGVSANKRATRGKRGGFQKVVT
jgi:hypothetical protein